MVPRHDTAAEDDGWLLSFVYDPADDRSDLVVIAAADPHAGPVATVELPVRVPMGFHGNWIPAAVPRPSRPRAAAASVTPA